jgi:hypothetical protein
MVRILKILKDCDELSHTGQRLVTFDNYLKITGKYKDAIFIKGESFLYRKLNKLSSRQKVFLNKIPTLYLFITTFLPNTNRFIS